MVRVGSERVVTLKCQYNCVMMMFACDVTVESLRVCLCLQQSSVSGSHVARLTASRTASTTSVGCTRREEREREETVNIMETNFGEFLGDREWEGEREVEQMINLGPEENKESWG